VRLRSRRGYRHLAVVAAVASLFVTVSAGASQAGGGRAAPLGVSDLKEDLDRILGDARLTNAQAGAVVTSARTGEMLYSKNGNGALVPASNEKLLTSAAAFELLGADHTFTTTALTDGDRAGGAVRGDLYLKGTGDPTMLGAGYDDLAAKVAAAGVKVVRGDLVADDTWFDDQRLGPFWAWDDEPFSYSAPVSALTVAPDTDYDAGAIIVAVAPGASAGDPAKVSLTPATGHVKVVNKAVTGEDSTIAVDRAHGSNTITVTGSIPAGAAPVNEYMSVWEPTGYAADVFRRALEAHGVDVRGKTTRGATPEGADKVADRRSPPLSEVSVPFLKLSNNAIAEILVKSIGRKAGGEGTWSAGLAAISKFLTAHGVTGLRMTDGSGLSRADVVAPETLTTLLAAMRSKPWFTAWYDALPVAGDPDRLVGGTLRSRMRDTAAAGNVHAKTGTLTSVSALSGYVNGADGEPLIFSVVLNNHIGAAPKDVEDAVAIRLAQFKRDTATDGEPQRTRLRVPPSRPGGPDPGAVECSWLRAC
jgi:serine-type D-Ala-D-Ala carboxypeptidase/endopeptidase (penicillin-binding protein 4)